MYYHVHPSDLAAVQQVCYLPQILRRWSCVRRLVLESLDSEWVQEFMCSLAQRGIWLRLLGEGNQVTSVFV